MDFLPLASVWHNFWNWFDHLSNPDKIAYWSFLGGIAVSPVIGYIAALAGARKGAEAAFNLGRAKQEEETKANQLSALNFAHYVLSQHWNALAAIADQQFDIAAIESGKFKIPHIHIPEPIIPLSLENLAFVADIEPRALRDIEITDRMYLSTFEQFRELKKLTIRFGNGERGSELLAAIKKAMIGIHDGFEHNLPLIEQVIGTVAKFREIMFPKGPHPELHRYKRVSSQLKPESTN